MITDQFQVFTKNGKENNKLKHMSIIGIVFVLNNIGLDKITFISFNDTIDEVNGLI